MLEIGAAPALVAAVFIQLATFHVEPPSFRLFPRTKEEWVNYWFRSLFLAVLCRMAAFGYTSGSCPGLLAWSTILLFISSFVFMGLAPGFSIVGLMLTVAAIASAILFPTVNQ